MSVALTTYIASNDRMSENKKKIVPYRPQRNTVTAVGQLHSVSASMLDGGKWSMSCSSHPEKEL
jgi:hypothetical protein